MGMPALQERHWTADEVRALPEVPGKRFEVVDGELLVSPGPRFRHQQVLADLQAQLFAYVRQHNIGYVTGGPGEIQLDASTLVQPDLYVLHRDVMSVKPESFYSWTAEPSSVLLVVEALSPSTARHDRVVKLARYRRQRIEYWIVDHEAGVIERWLPDATHPEILAQSLTWRVDEVDEPLVIDLHALFTGLYPSG
jgi:Uma2 family endonuclease